MRKENETICYEISRCFDVLHHAMKTGELDVPDLSNRLHKMRVMATHMENGLKSRKEVLEKHGLEEEYQKLKGKKYTPPGINKVRGRNTMHRGKMEFEVIVKENGELVYQNKSFGAVVSVVERIEDMDNQGTINGQAQTFMVGHPLTLWFAFDQLRQSFEGKNLEVVAALKEAVTNNRYIDPKVKKQVLDAANNIVK